ncbi:MAG: hypothetical protein ACXWAC_13180 [Usitatibacter sp.]
MAADRIKVWQCVGCGRIDDPRPCVGICRDEKVEYVLATDHDTELRRARDEAMALRKVVESIALATPRDGKWERSYRALQDRARRAMRTGP